MRHLKRLTMAVLSLAVVFAASAGNGAAAKKTAGAGGAEEHSLLELDPSQFEGSENIDNPWFPLKPGMQWVLEGWDETDGEKTPHRIVFTVTDLTKTIAGVRTRVILDADYSEGTLVEKELTFFAQDKAGNVWHLGQYRETYESEFVGGRIWNVGNPEGAKAGIMMPADPKLGTPSYSEGFAPAPFNWTDRGRVYQVGQKTKVPTGSYDDVLVIEEFDNEKAGTFQLKYYAKGVGNVRVGWRGTGLEKENLELAKKVQLTPEALAEARATALDLEKRAMMYCTMPPMERIPLE